MKRYQMLGVEEIEMVCELCNKRHIGRAFTFRDLDTLDVIRVGSSCAKKLMSAKSFESLKSKKRNEITAHYQGVSNEAWSNYRLGLITYEAASAITKECNEAECKERDLYK